MPQTIGNSRNATVNVGLTSVEVSPRRDDETDLRKVFVIRNNSPAAADIITLELGFDAAVAGRGIVLSQGQAYGEDNDAGDVWRGPIKAICATANGVLAVMER